MKKTKWLVILVSCLIIIMISTSTTGCDSKKKDDQPDPTEYVKQIGDDFPTPEPENTDEPKDEQFNKYKDITELTLSDVQKTYPDKEVLVWVYNDLTYMEPRNNVRLNEILAEKGLDFVVYMEQINESNFERSINSKIDAGNAPDIICASVGEGGAPTGVPRAVANQWLEDLTSYMDTNAGQVLRKAFPDNIWETFYFNSGLYGVNGAFAFPTNYVYFVNKDIADKYSISLEELEGLEPHELEPFLEKVYEGEESDGFVTFNNNLSYNIPYFSIPFDVYDNRSIAIGNNTRQTDERCVNVFKDRDAVSYFHMISDYRKKGYITSPSKLENFFITYSSANIFDELSSMEIINLNNNFKESSNIEMVISSPSYLFTQLNTLTGICSQSINKDKAFEALSIIYSDKEITDLLLYGIEGLDYTIDNGQIKNIDPDGSFSWQKSMYFGNKMISSPAFGELKDKGSRLDEIYGQMYVPTILGTYLDMTYLSEKINNINAIIDQYAKGLFEGSYEDVDAILAELNQKLDSAGIQEILDELNRQYKALLK